MFSLEKTDFVVTMMLLFVLTLFFGFQSHSESLYTDLPSSSSFPTQKVLASILDPKAQDIDQVLGTLPEEMLERFVLAYDSQSLQHADPVNPRVILFSPLADLIVAFTCDPKDCKKHELKEKTLRTGFRQGSFNSLEFITFDWKRNQFEFGQRDFSEQKTSILKARGPKEKASAASASSSALCAACHAGATSPRPNWDPYRRWNGFYGEFDDGLTINEEGLGSSTKLARFITSAPNRLRYRHLRNLKKNFERTLKLAKGTVYAGERNSLFTQRLGALNARRVLSLAQKHPRFQAFLPVLLASLIDHVSNLEIAQYFPEGTLPEAVRECLSKEQDLQRQDHVGALSLLRILLAASGPISGVWHTMFTEREDFRKLYASLEFGPFALPGNMNVLFTDLLMQQVPETKDFLKGRTPGTETKATPQLLKKLSELSRSKLQKLLDEDNFKWVRQCPGYTRASMPSGSN